MYNFQKLFSIIFFLTTCTTFAQEYKFEAGILGGPGRVSIYGNDYAKNFKNARLGFSAGAFFQYHFSEKISLLTNLLYEEKGAGSNLLFADANGQPTGTVTVKNRLSYLTLPVLCRLTLGNKIKYFINAGPYFGYLLHDVTVVKFKSSHDKFKYNFTNWDNRFDTGISAGIGLSIPVSNSLSLSLEARNNLGLTNTSKTTFTDNGKVKVNSTTLLAGISYKFGKK